MIAGLIRMWCALRFAKARFVMGLLGALSFLLWFGAIDAQAAVTATTTFTTPGTYAFTVPDGVTSISVTAIGAGGGAGWCVVSSGGGHGASVTATLPVSSGQQLFVGVASPGGSNTCGSAAGGGGVGGGAAGGGGSGGGNVGGGGGGGGASVLGSASPSPAFGGVMVVAGGGGGGGGGLGGGTGGNAGSAGLPSASSSAGGGAGTASAGGSGGGAGAAGSFGFGGSGAGSISSGGGGGGGGYYGGGGGDGGLNGGGGGGGSSFTAPGATNISGPTPTSSPAEVSLTYDAPTADENTTSMGLGTQAQGVASAPQDLTVANRGSAPLVVSALSLTGTNPHDYLLDNGCQTPVPVGDSCTIGIRFQPAAGGASTATLTLTTNAPTSPASVALSGTGGQLPQGPPGQTGATGQTGAAGPQGPAGKIELVVCNVVRKTVTTHGHKHKVTVRKCTTKLVSRPVKFTTRSDDLGASVARAGVTYATGLAIPTGTDRWRLVLTRHLRRLRAGRYTLTLMTRHGRPRIVARTTIMIT
jgi:hypothetical protein